VQVGYLGYPGTSGAPPSTTFWATSLSFPTPPASIQEQVVYLPECFQANEERRIAALRRGHGRSRSAGRPLCSAFNTSYKSNRAQPHTSTLFDTQRFCGHLESAYVRMWNV